MNSIGIIISKAAIFIVFFFVWFFCQSDAAEPAYLLAMAQAS